MRLLDVATHAHDLAARLKQLEQRGSTGPEEQAAILLLAGQLEAARAGTTASFASSFAGNADGSVRRSLGSTAIDLGSQISGFILSAQAGLQSTDDRDLTRIFGGVAIDARQLELNARIFTAWHETADELKRLLEARVDGLMAKLRLALGVSVLVALFAVALAIGIFRTMLSKLDERILFLAHHDPLTGLLNRASFGERAQNYLAALKPGEVAAVVLLDLDRFKRLNDSHGHKQGDSAITTMAQRVTGLLGEKHLVCRLGGDEFIVLCQGMTSEADAVALAQKIIETMRQPFILGETSFCTTASAGVAIAPRDGHTLADLMIAGDLALYAAKRAGRNCVMVFEEHMMSSSRRRVEIEREIRDALAGDSFTLEFQPQFDCQGYRLCGFEALLRLRGSDGGLISPADLIPVAEETKLIVEIGAWVVRKTCLTAVQWPPHLFAAVNISPVELANSDVAAVVEAALRESGLQPHRLEIEITESALMEPSPVVMEQLHRLQKLGVSIAIDDFGAGYSGLNYLWKFSFDKLKIDRSLTKGTGDTASAMNKVFKGVVSIGQDLSMRVTAEGVETAEQQVMLADMGCQLFQGYHLGRPMKEVDLPAFILNEWRRPLPDFADQKPRPGSIQAIRHKLSQLKAVSQASR
jgi:diguanylate cyclase (GGDEF)-like protein